MTMARTSHGDMRVIRRTFPGHAPDHDPCTDTTEIVMNKAIQSNQELLIVELGDAKELTQGPPGLFNIEDNPQMAYKLEG